jgi:2-haloacid dehalogenase
MKRFVFLDLDDTIFDFHKAERIALSKTLETLGLQPEPAVLARYSEINAEQWRLLERGELSREEVKERRYRLLFEEFGMEISPVLTARTYERNLSIGHYFVEGAEALLETLSRTFRLFLVSNGSSDIQRSRISSSDIPAYFEKIFISEEVGFNKPDVRFFDAVFAEIPDFDRAQAVIVGDSLSSDIKGGKNCGITTVWFNPKGLEAPADVQPDYTISRLCELPFILSKM